MIGERETMVCRVIKSLAVNYPILLDNGCGFEKLLMLVTGQGDMSTVLRTIGGDTPLIIYEGMTRAKITSILTTENSKPVFYLFSPSAKGHELIRNLALMIKMGTFGKQNISVIPILVSERIPPDVDLSECFSVYLDTGLRELTIKSEEVVPTDSQVAVVLDKIKDFTVNVKTQEEKSLKAAACFLYPILKEENEGADFPEYLELVEKLIVSDDENQDINSSGEIFLRELYRWQEANEFSNVYELPDLEMEATKNFEGVILFDEQFVYLKDSLFKEILGTLLEIFSIDALKNSLVGEKILCPSQKKSYTTKVGYYNVAGEFDRVRMLRFDRSKLKMVGELDFIELCIDGKER